MTALPHDVTDLYLAPVLLAVDRRIEEYAALEVSELAGRIALASDLPDHTIELRERALLKALAHLIDLHDWVLTWDPRGLRLSHHSHSLVLGVPMSFSSYVLGG